MIDPLRPFARHSVLCAALIGAVGVTALALANTDALLRRGFETAFATSASEATVERTRAALPVSGSESFWLTRPAANVALTGTGPVKSGDRITMGIEGARTVELEVVGVAEVSADLRPIQASSTLPRLIMVTCREVGDSDRPGRLVRFIVETGTESTDSAVPANAL